MTIRGIIPMIPKSEAIDPAHDGQVIVWNQPKGRGELLPRGTPAASGVVEIDAPGIEAPAPQPTDQIRIYEGSGVIVDAHTDPAEPVTTAVSWAEQIYTPTPPFAVATLILFMDATGAAPYLVDSRDYTALHIAHRDAIRLGIVYTDTAQIYRARFAPTVTNSAADHVNDLSILNEITVISGGIPAPSATQPSLELALSDTEIESPGINWINNKAAPNVIKHLQADPAPFFYYDSQGEYGTATGIDPEQYESDPEGAPGVLVPVPAGYWTIHALIVGAYGSVAALRPQLAYFSYQAAKNAVIDYYASVEAPTLPYTSRIGYAVAQQGVAALGDDRVYPSREYFPSRIDDLLTHEALPLPHSAAEPTVTGVYEGGELTLASPTEILVTAGNGYIVDQRTDPAAPAFIAVTWAQQQLAISNIDTRAATYVFIDASGLVLLRSDANTFYSDTREYIYLGFVVHNQDAANLIHANATPFVGRTTGHLVHDLARAAHDGLLIDYATTTTMQIDAGVARYPGVNFYVDRNVPNSINIAARNPASCYYLDGTGSVYAPATTTIDVTQYDPAGAGVVDVLKNNKAKIDRVFSGIQGAGTFIQFGQTEWASFSDAQENVNADENAHIYPEITGFMLFLGWIIIEKGAALDNTDEAQFINARQGTGGGGGGSGPVTVQSYIESAGGTEGVYTEQVAGTVTVKTATTNIASFPAATGTVAVYTGTPSDDQVLTWTGSAWAPKLPFKIRDTAGTTYVATADTTGQVDIKPVSTDAVIVKTQASYDAAKPDGSVLQLPPAGWIQGYDSTGAYPAGVLIGSEGAGDRGSLSFANAAGERLLQLLPSGINMVAGGSQIRYWDAAPTPVRGEGITGFYHNSQLATLSAVRNHTFPDYSGVIPLYTGTPAADQVLTWNGSEWEPRAGGGGGSSSKIQDTAGTTYVDTAATAGQVDIKPVSTDAIVVKSQVPYYTGQPDGSVIQLPPSGWIQGYDKTGVYPATLLLGSEDAGDQGIVSIANVSGGRVMQFGGTGLNIVYPGYQIHYRPTTPPARGDGFAGFRHSSTVGTLAANREHNFPDWSGTIPLYTGTPTNEQVLTWNGSVWTPKTTSVPPAGYPAQPFLSPTTWDGVWSSRIFVYECDSTVSSTFPLHINTFDTFTALDTTSDTISTGTQSSAGSGVLNARITTNNTTQRYQGMMCVLSAPSGGGANARVGICMRGSHGRYIQASCWTWNTTTNTHNLCVDVLLWNTSTSVHSQRVFVHSLQGASYIGLRIEVDNTLYRHKVWFTTDGKKWTFYSDETHDVNWTMQQGGPCMTNHHFTSGHWKWLARYASNTAFPTLPVWPAA